MPQTGVPTRTIDELEPTITTIRLDLPQVFGGWAYASFVRPLLVIALLGCVFAGSAPSAVASPTTVGQLTAPAGQTLGPIAVLQSTAVAIDRVGGNGVLYQASTAGWMGTINPSATLTDSTATPAQPLTPALTGEYAVLSENPTSGASFADVFVKPSGGWSGVVAQSARLLASDGGSLSEPAAAGELVAVSGRRPDGTGAVYVFARPEGGWGGTVHEIATLADPTGAPIGQVATNGSVVVAAVGDHADVFVEPAGGWSSDLRPTAILDTHEIPSGGIGLSGRTAFAGEQVFAEPEAGWRGTIQPAAGLYLQGALELGHTGFDGSLAALSSSGAPAQHSCPCQTRLWLFSRPRRGWSGELTAKPSLAVVNDTGVADFTQTGGDLFLAEDNRIAIYATAAEGSAARRPLARDARITGLAAGVPTLQLTLRAAIGSPPLTSLSIRLPRGLAFTSSARRHLTLRATRGRCPSVQVFAKGLRGQCNPVSRIALKTSRDAITATHQLITRVRAADRSHRHRLTISVYLGSGNVLGIRTASKITVRLR